MCVCIYTTLWKYFEINYLETDTHENAYDNKTDLFQNCPFICLISAVEH